MTCRTADCRNPGSRYIYGTGVLRNLTVLCDACHAELVKIGMDLRPEAPVETSPRWIGRLTARDESGWITTPSIA